jgi:hypothetical protein
VTWRLHDLQMPGRLAMRQGRMIAGVSIPRARVPESAAGLIAARRPGDFPVGDLIAAAAWSSRRDV